MSPKLLIVDDEANMRFVLEEIFREDGYEVRTATTGGEAIAQVQRWRPDAAILDLRLPDMTGIDVLKKMSETARDTIVVVVTAYSSVETAIEAMKLGAYDYITKPFKIEKLKMLLANGVAGRKASGLDARVAVGSGLGACDAPSAFHGVIGSNEEVNRIFSMISRIAPTNATVLLYGESGTGKELLADYIHATSLRAGKPLVKVNCAAIPETLLESELFGHEKGAFTSAVSKRIGRFEQADGGTIFLDEIGEMSLAMQAKLLRVIQEREFTRVGGTETIKVDVRIVAATNKDLRQAIANHTFREDLYYRLSVVPIYLPPLRERRDDIPELAMSFLEKYSLRNGKDVRGISSEAMQALLDYPWPGNIRELENTIERAVILANGPELTREDLFLSGDPVNLPARTAPGLRESGLTAGQAGRDDAQVPLSLEELEKKHIMKVLEHTSMNRTEAAKLLRITRRTLLNKIKKYGL